MLASSDILIIEHYNLRFRDVVAHFLKRSFTKSISHDPVICEGCGYGRHNSIAVEEEDYFHLVEGGRGW